MSTHVSCRRAGATRSSPVVLMRTMFGISFGELGFVAVLIGLVLLAPLAPRVGETIGGLFEEKPPKGR